VTEALFLLMSDTPVDWEELLEQARRRQAGPRLAILFESLEGFLPDLVPAGFVGQLRRPVEVVPVDTPLPESSRAQSSLVRLRQSCGSLWRSYGRAAQQQSRRRTLRGFARFLVGHWRLSSPWRLPGAIGRKGLRLMSGSARLL
jgi:hypothetical protein